MEEENVCDIWKKIKEKIKNVYRRRRKKKRRSKKNSRGW